MDNDNRKNSFSDNNDDDINSVINAADGDTVAVPPVDIGSYTEPVGECETVVFGEDEKTKKRSAGKSEYLMKFEENQRERAEKISLKIHSNLPAEEETDNSEEPVSVADKKTNRSDAFDFVEMIVFSVVFVVLLFTLCIRNVFVDGNSMVPTLQDRDLLIITDVTDYDYGDIIVFLPEHAELSVRLQKPFIKRVIAMAGDVVDVDYENNRVMVNNEAVDESYLSGLVMQNLGNVKFPFTVPEHHIFFMGDNRNESWDSRYTEVGTVDERLVMGKVLVRLFPFDKIGTVK